MVSNPQKPTGNGRIQSPRRVRIGRWNQVADVANYERFSATTMASMAILRAPGKSDRRRTLITEYRRNAIKWQQGNRKCHLRHRPTLSGLSKRVSLKDESIVLGPTFCLVGGCGSCFRMMTRLGPPSTRPKA